MTKEELKNYFTEVIHVGHEDYPVWELLQKYYTIQGIERYYLPVTHTEWRWIVTVAWGDCCGRRTHDRLHDEDFHLESNQALEGDWLLKPDAGFWKIVSDEWVRSAKEIDVYELDMREVKREDLVRQLNSHSTIYPELKPEGRPLMQIVQFLKLFKQPGEYDVFYHIGNGLKVYSCDTPETLAERIIGREQTLPEMLDEIGNHNMADTIRRLDKEKSQQDEITQEPVQEEA